MPWADDGGNAWNANACSPVAPNPDGVGEACTVTDGVASGFDSCDATSMCWGLGRTLRERTCVAFCTGTADAPECEPVATTCVTLNTDVLALCLATCDPLLQNCPAGEGCYIGPAPRPFCLADESGRNGAFGDPCEFINVCDPGLLCVAQEHVPNCVGNGCCTTFCDLSATPPTCQDGGQTCIAWYDDPPPQLEDVGFCGVE
jgi:hypothetical protein